MGKNVEVVKYTQTLTRLMLWLKEIKNVAEEIQTNDMVLVAHLLILDSIRIKSANRFTGVDIHRAKGSGKKQ